MATTTVRPVSPEEHEAFKQLSCESRCEKCDLDNAAFFVLTEGEHEEYLCAWCTGRKFTENTGSVLLNRDRATEWAKRHIKDWNALPVMLMVLEYEASQSHVDREDHGTGYVEVNVSEDLLDEEGLQENLANLAFPEGWEVFQLWHREACI
jgi:hypothetical protein